MYLCHSEKYSLNLNDYYLNCDLLLHHGNMIYQGWYLTSVYTFYFTLISRVGNVSCNRASQLAITLNNILINLRIS